MGGLHSELLCAKESIEFFTRSDLLPVPIPDEYEKTSEEYAKARNKATHPSGPEIAQNITEYIYQEFCKALELPQQPFDQKFDPTQYTDQTSGQQKNVWIKPIGRAPNRSRKKHE